MANEAPAGNEPSTQPDEGERLVDENGVDLTLVRYTLSLTPTERLKGVQDFMNAMASVRPLPSAEK